jgi:glycosyltransferase involved in cell wall biosynthesis
MKKPNNPVNRIALLGNHLPRKCGIATFTSDLYSALSSQYPDIYNIVIPINDIKDGYNYPSNVRFDIDEDDINSYKSAADFININNFDIVCLQHEYGIFGGKNGTHIVQLLDKIKSPVVTTFHTILQNPNNLQKKVLCDIAELSNRVVTMSEIGREFLIDVYNIPEEKIDFIHHGIPDVPFIDPHFYKDKFEAEGKTVLLTFGLLSRGKGIEYAISALPEIVKKHPDTVYFIVGATHPNVIATEGETYREYLIALAEELGVSENVKFFNRFVEIEELVEFIGAAEIYVTPYLNEHQITSGTLAYAFGSGRAVVSTGYWHAKELLKGGKGRIVPFKDSKAIAKEVIDLMDNEVKMHSMRKKAYNAGRSMIWSEVANVYMDSFNKARTEFGSNNNHSVNFITKPHSTYLPSLNLDHMLRMTDNTGMLQHACYTVPNYVEGYTIDDNARALITTILLQKAGDEYLYRSYNLAIRYLAFINFAWNDETKRFRNFMSFDRRWLEESGSEDSHGRTLWALGMLLGRSSDKDLLKLAGKLFENALEKVTDFTSPRAWAYTIIGINEYLGRYSGDRAVKKIRLQLAKKLMLLYKQNASEDWVWFENKFAYDNAKLSHALLMSGQWIGSKSMTEAGLKTLKWLVEIQTSERGNFSPIGSNGFYEKGGERAYFDQQPLEAHAMVSACLEAYRVTNDVYWQDEAFKTFEWFLGRNDLGQPVYDSQTGGCCDGLHPDRVNENQGAESTLSFLMSQLEMKTAQRKNLIDSAAKLKFENILNIKNEVS